MNKKFLIIVPVLLVLSSVLVIIKNLPQKQFYLEDKYYGSSDFIEINADNLKQLIDDKESFALFVYQPGCITSANFQKNLEKFTQNNNIQFYKMPFSDIKNTTLNKKIEYYPSFAIFNKGTLIDYLDAGSDNDLKYYESQKEFKTWFTDYVLLKKTNSSNATQTSNNESTNNIDTTTDKTAETTTNVTPENATSINLENVTKDPNKVNIYFFWGSTCPHCKAEFAFFDEIKAEYGQYYNLYTYEVWENPNNADIMSTFANALNDSTTAVPYTVVGDESFIGFGESTKEKIINAIKNNHKNSRDVYFDKIKK